MAFIQSTLLDLHAPGIRSMYSAGADIEELEELTFELLINDRGWMTKLFKRKQVKQEAIKMVNEILKS